MWPRCFLHLGACRQLRDKICSRRRHASGQCGHAHIHFADPSPRKVVGVDAAWGGHSCKTFGPFTDPPVRSEQKEQMEQRLALAVDRPFALRPFT